MKKYFSALADLITSRMADHEFFTANFYAEQSDFVRFNKAKVRQAGSVKQADLELALIDQGRCVEGTVCLANDAAIDQQRIDQLLGSLRENIQFVAADPHLLYNTEPHDTDHVDEQCGFTTATMLESVLQQAAGTDFVGILTAGNMAFGFANSLGQRNWHSSNSFNLDWSLYLGTSGDAKDKAVKCAYAGANWDNAVFTQKIQDAKIQLAQLARPAITIEPGHYRAYLAPAALEEILSLMNWGGFSQSSTLTKQSPLQKLQDAHHSLSTKVSLTENTAGSVAPRFQPDGYIKPDAVELIKQGKPGTLLCSPRTAKEYGLTHNGAFDHEGAIALDMAAGDLAVEDILSELDTGLYISNLWYLNYSDRPSGRFTGMTRFATFWVENGEIIAPVNVVRFDDTIFNLFGEKLMALTQERDFILDSSTYEQRSAASYHLPGALVSELTVTL